MSIRATLFACTIALAFITISNGGPPQPGYAADADTDKDGVSDPAETNCGGNATDPNLRPERRDDQFANRDDDGDQAIDEALPGTAAGYDCDGDGFTGQAEANIFAIANVDQDACGANAWPADIVSGGMPTSTNRVTITDITSFVAPVRRMNTSPPNPNYDRRWDLIPGAGIFGDVINITDLTALLSGNSGSPPMLGGKRALTGPACPWPITTASYATSLIPNTAQAEAVAFVPIPGSPGEAALVTQHPAQVWRVSLTGIPAPSLFGDLSSLSGGSGFEEGLLALAFSPGYPGDQRVYAYYTQGSPQPSILSRLKVVGGVIDANTVEPLISVPQPYNNHNGGELAFGPDGYLYLSLGDGGSGGDPLETGQDNTDLLASVLRINVSGATGYTIPSDNPYFGATPGRDEVWAYGFRNPWRFSFDTYTGNLWVGDVGQGAWEEIDIVTGGGNYGWDNMEGFVCFEPSSGCSQSGLLLPEYAYDHSAGACAITGGHVYHGASMPELAGWYIYGDYCNGRIWALDGYGSGANILLIDMPYLVTSFARLPDGEMAVVTQNDGVYRLIRS